MLSICKRIVSTWCGKWIIVYAFSSGASSNVNESRRWEFKCLYIFYIRPINDNYPLSIFTFIELLYSSFLKRLVSLIFQCFKRRARHRNIQINKAIMEWNKSLSWLKSNNEWEERENSLNERHTNHVPSVNEQMHLIFSFIFYRHSL